MEAVGAPETHTHIPFNMIHFPFSTLLLGSRDWVAAKTLTYVSSITLSECEQYFSFFRQKEQRGEAGPPAGPSSA
jgi:hypothetical protein